MADGNFQRSQCMKIKSIFLNSFFFFSFSLVIHIRSTDAATVVIPEEVLVVDADRKASVMDADRLQAVIFIYFSVDRRPYRWVAIKILLMLYNNKINIVIIELENSSINIPKTK